jgi:hypothetical protein
MTAGGTPAGVTPKAGFAPVSGSPADSDYLGQGDPEPDDFFGLELS